MCWYLCCVHSIQPVAELQGNCLSANLTNGKFMRFSLHCHLITNHFPCWSNQDRISICGAGESESSRNMLGLLKESVMMLNNHLNGKTKVSFMWKQLTNRILKAGETLKCIHTHEPFLMPYWINNTQSWRRQGWSMQTIRKTNSNGLERVSTEFNHIRRWHRSHSNSAFWRSNIEIKL